MASTSTNKQPLLIDRVLFESINLTDVITGNPNNSDITGTNNARILVNSVSADGAIIEEIRAISRGTTNYTINLYMSIEADYLRPGTAQFIGSINLTSPADKQVFIYDQMPVTLAPVANVGTDPQLKALYVPKGKALWAAIESDTQGMADAPYVQIQGGFY